MPTAVMLSRIQFGFAVGFHFLFPATTLGLALFILIFETLYLILRRPIDQQISTFLVRLLAVVYVMGIATGATLEFSFGANWAAFSQFVGGVFGVPIAIEGITAFALEAVFLGILLFGRQRVAPGLYWLSACLVFFGAHLSGFWVLAANSWMQTPAGYVLQNGKAVLVDFARATFNYTTWDRFFHTVLACWMAGASVTTALAAGYLLAKKHEAFARRLLLGSLLLFSLLPLAQLVAGHSSAVAVDKYQPVKSAALEGIFKTQRHAPLLILGWPDAKNHTIRLALGIPGFLSVLVGWNFETEIKGLEDFPTADWPPVNVVFTTFHLMVVLGFLSIGLGLLAAWLWFRKQLLTTQWFLHVLVLTFWVPYVALELGWMSTEIGRQPWVVYGLLRTSQAASSSVTTGQVAFSLSLLFLLYAALFAVFALVVAKIIRQGPPAAAKPNSAEA